MSSAAHAQSIDEVRRGAVRDIAGDDLKGRDGPLGKVHHDLAVLYRAYEQGAGRGKALVEEMKRPLLAVKDGYVTIEAIAAGENARALHRDLERLGMRNAAQANRLVSGRLPIQAIAEMAALSTLHSAYPSLAVTHVGRVTTRGDRVIGTASLREAAGVTGAGITVGIISDTFSDNEDVPLTSPLDDVASGDLPPLSEIIIIDDEGGPSADEGRAMMQIVHDIAPGATLAFHTGLGGQVNYAQGILELADAGARVLVDDLQYLNEPMFQDGIIAQSVEEVVVERGAAYFSASGNTGRMSYESAFRVSDQRGPNGGVLHDFDPGANGVDAQQGIVIPPGATVSFAFQWDEPFASLGGPGSRSNLNLYLTDTQGQILERGTFRNVGGDPVELISFVNSTTSENFQLLIELVEGPPPGLMKYVYFTDQTVEIAEFATNSATLYGHANARGAFSTAASIWPLTPEFGTTPPVVNDFSATGGVPILFDEIGNRIGPILREKPDATGPDGVNTTFFGVDFAFDDDSFPNFLGTSAAAPHVAAGAALMLEAQPDLTPAEIYEAMRRTAIDIVQSVDLSEGTRSPVGQGFDNTSGAGLVQVDEALTSPDEINAFVAVPEGDRAAQLAWEEVDSGIEQYVVQRSYFGGPFIEVATLPGGQGTYSLVVDDLEVGSHQFRLFWERANGTESTGQRVHVEIQLQEDAELSAPFPNPTPNGFNVVLTVQETQEVLVTLFNVLGQRVAVLALEDVRANTPTTFRAPDGIVRQLSSGIYFVRAQGDNFDEASKVVILR